MEAVLGSAGHARRAPLSGGDINLAHALTLADGRTVFAKTNAARPAGMFAAEARGLGWLRRGARHARARGDRRGSRDGESS